MFRAPVTTKAHLDSTADVTGALNISATASLSPIAIDFSDVPVIGTKFPISTVAAGGAVSSGSGGTAIGGSIIVDVFTLDTEAYLAGSAHVNQSSTPDANSSVSVTATDDTTVKNGAGGLAATAGSAGVGIALDVEVINKTTSASIGTSALVSAGKDISVKATSTEKLLAIAVSIGASGGTAVAASIIDVQGDADACTP